MNCYYQLTDLENIADENIKDIKKQYGKKKVKEWELIDVDKLEPAEAFDRGFYRAMSIIKNRIKELN